MDEVVDYAPSYFEILIILGLMAAGMLAVTLLIKSALIILPMTRKVER